MLAASDSRCNRLADIRYHGYMSTALQRLAEVAAQHRAELEQWYATRDQLIIQARAEGATWDEVASAAGMSNAGVRNAERAARGGRAS